MGAWRGAAGTPRSQAALLLLPPLAFLQGFIHISPPDCLKLHETLFFFLHIFFSLGERRRRKKKKNKGEKRG